MKFRWAQKAQQQIYKNDKQTEIQVFTACQLLTLLPLKICIIGTFTAKKKSYNLYYKKRRVSLFVRPSVRQSHPSVIKYKKNLTENENKTE